MAEPARPTRRSRMALPMTGTIDCVFQLLIFFLLMPSVVAEEGYLTGNLPTDSGPLSGDQRSPECIRIELRDDGPDGRGVRIVLNRHQALGANFKALQSALEDLRRRGLSSAVPVLIEPAMRTRHRWMVRAVDAAVAARFESIRFAVPDELMRKAQRPKMTGDTLAGTGWHGALR